MSDCAGPGKHEGRTWNVLDGGGDRTCVDPTSVEPTLEGEPIAVRRAKLGEHEAITSVEWHGACASSRAPARGSIESNPRSGSAGSAVARQLDRSKRTGPNRCYEAAVAVRMDPTLAP